MEIDPPHETSDGSTTESEKSDIYMVSYHDSGDGLPYAPEDFPNPGDKWGWKVGKRVGIKGYFRDRYLYLLTRLYEELKSVRPTCIPSSKGFASKSSVERFLLDVFPGMDTNAFFASFKWNIPAQKIKDQNNAENAEFASVSTPNFDPAGCKAGNINCSSLQETNHSNVMPCDICCIEPLFCHDCCCILCSKTVNSLNGDQSFIRCEAMVKDGLICGHICHIKCGLRSYMAGTVGGKIGLDVEYYCRRCDARTDLIPYVTNLFRSGQHIDYGEKIPKILNLCVIILRGSTRPSAKALLHHVQSAVTKLKDGNSHEDIWKREETSTVTTGEVSQCETHTLEVSRVKKPSQHQISFPNFDYRLESIKLEEMIYKTLASLKKSQETEYKIAEDVLTTQKNYLLDLYEELDKEKKRLAKCYPSADPSLVRAVFMRMGQIKTEFDKINTMQTIGKRFGKTSKNVLKEHFGVKAGDNC